MGVADLAQPFEVARWRREAAAGVLDRFDEHRRDGVGPLEQDRLLDAVGGPAPEHLEVAAVVQCQMGGRAVRVGVGHLERPGHQRLVRDAQLRHTGDRQRALRRAVVRDRTADHLVLRGLAGQLEVLLGQLPGALDGLSAARGEEDPVEVAGSEVGQPLRQVDGRRVGVGPDREEGQLGRLTRGRLGELAAPVPGLHDEEAGETVQVGTTAGVPDPAALPPHHDRYLRAVLVGGVPGEVHPQVVAGGVGVRGAPAGAAGLRDGSGHVLGCCDGLGR